MFVFFFQAEDGIRDLTVTGVQTCALPIYLEALAETGILGGLCCAWFLAVLFRESLSRMRQLQNSFAGSLQLSGLVACAGFLVHSTVDFNLHIPSNALLFFLLALLAPSDVPSMVPARSRHQDTTNR